MKFYRKFLTSPSVFFLILVYSFIFFYFLEIEQGDAYAYLLNHSMLSEQNNNNSFSLSEQRSFFYYLLFTIEFIFRNELQKNTIFLISALSFVLFFFTRLTLYLKGNTFSNILSISILLSPTAIYALTSNLRSGLAISLFLFSFICIKQRLWKSFFLIVPPLLHLGVLVLYSVFILKFVRKYLFKFNYSFIFSLIVSFIVCTLILGLIFVLEMGQIKAYWGAGLLYTISTLFVSFTIMRIYWSNDELSFLLMVSFMFALMSYIIDFHNVRYLGFSFLLLSLHVMNKSFMANISVSFSLICLVNFLAVYHWYLIIYG
jgi:hypothetical protein